MKGMPAGHGERRDRIDRRVSGRRSGNRRASERRQQFVPVAIDRRNGAERRTSDRRVRAGRRVHGDRRALGLSL